MNIESIQTLFPSRAIQPGETLETTRVHLAASMRSVLNLAEKPSELTQEDVFVMKAHLQCCLRKLFVQGVNLHSATLFQRSREAQG